MGIPYEKAGISIISIVITGTLDEINSLRYDLSMNKILEKLYKTNFLADDELLYLLNNMSSKTKSILFNYANKTRISNYGKKVYLRGLIEFSNYCKGTCQYCGLRCKNKKVDRYRLTKEQVLECCILGNSLGYKTFVLQSGEDDFFTDDILEDIIREIKKRFLDSVVTLSIGEKSYESYQKFFEAGADRYLLRHETASKELYDNLHPGMSFQNRRECLEHLKQIGYQIGAGFIVGLPGQTNEILVEDLLYLKKLQPHMVGIGPLIVHPDTPLRNYKGGTLDKTLICLALTRLLLPEVLLPSTTALNVLEPIGLERTLQVGANVIMPNISPAFAREKYELYKGKASEKYEDAIVLENIKKKIKQAGYEVDMGRGDHKSWSR